MRLTVAAPPGRYPHRGFREDAGRPPRPKDLPAVTTLTVSDRSPSDVKADALVLAVVRSGAGAVLADGARPGPQDRGPPGRGAVQPVRGWCGRGGAPGARRPRCRRDPWSCSSGWAPPPAGDASYDAESLRRAAGAAIRALTGRPKVALSLPGDDAESVGAAAEGALFGAYAFAGHRGDSGREGRREGRRPAGAHRPGPGRPCRRRAGRDRWPRRRTTPATWSTPRPTCSSPGASPSRSRPAPRAAPVKVTVMDEKALAKAGCGGIIGVGQGSVRPAAARQA